MKVANKTFPGLKSNNDCLKIIDCENQRKTETLPSLILTVILNIIFLIGTVISFGMEFGKMADIGYYDETLQKWQSATPEYNWGLPIFFLICTIVLFVIMLKVLNKYNECSKMIDSANYTIKINNQYQDFIFQGYESKEAYKLTIEWIDRQNYISSIDSLEASVCAMGGIIAMSNIIKHK